LLATAFILAILSLRDLGEGSLWGCVYRAVPGATAIRAVGRIGLVVQLFALIGGLITLDALIRVPERGRGAWYAVVALVLLVGAAEQVVVNLPSFEADTFYPRAEALGKKLRVGTAAYVYPDGEMAWITSELLGMWAGLHANRPVINGYSGRSPEGFPPTFPMPPEEAFGWLAANMPPGRRWPGRLCYVVPTHKGSKEYRTFLLEAEDRPPPSGKQATAGR
jgi:hypothetical protein